VKATHFCYSGPGAEESSKRTRYGKFGYVGKAWVPGCVGNCLLSWCST
jgi:hypothetical protein